MCLSALHQDPSPPPLRDYQSAMVASVEHQLSLHRSTLVESATGTGKTTLIAAVIQREVSRGGRVLVTAHRRELVDQLVARVELFGVQVGIERGPRRAGDAPCVAASVQTLARRLHQWSPDAFTLVIVDESHHAVAGGYRQVLTYFRTAKILGVTATADRADGVALGTVFDSVAARYSITDAVTDGHLVRARCLQVDVPGMDLSKVRTRTNAGATDLNQGDLGRAALAPAAVEGVAGPLLELAGDRRTVVFCVDRAHAAAVAGALCARRAGCARVVHGAMAQEERARNLADHRTGQFQFLVNVAILCEGYDDPAIDCVAMARPTQSRTLWAQCVGRGLRLGTDKADCLVLDFVGVSCKFDLIGPGDVLAGIVVESSLVRPVTNPQPAQPANTYQPRPRWFSRFTTKVVELVRGIERKAVGWLDRLLGL